MFKKLLFKMNLCFFASGSGSNVNAILSNIKNGNLNANPSLIITNNSKAGVVEKAKSNNIPYYHISNKTEPDDIKRTQKILELLSYYKVDLIILAGYMKLIPSEILSKYKNKILNIHPALLPKFGGKGMYGINVHNAVIKSGVKISGATVHIVNNEYDQGKILAQKTVDIDNSDTPETLQKKVLKAEHSLYSETINKIINKEIQLF